ncbi:MAG: hypothetical protein EOP00_04200 [Pedobacter sp.]|nr:MAG: hypothetical protein EOP00_04200 [Pedobacter sp.]
MYAERDKWASHFKPLKNKDFILVGGIFGSPFYYLTRLLHKLLRNIIPLAYGYDKVSWLLYRKGLAIKADLYIGHNLAALPVIVKLAKKNNSKCGFDAEDFHRNEVTDDTFKTEFIKAKALEDEFIEQIDYLTGASPLICEAYELLYPKFKAIVINNVFTNKQLITPKEKNYNFDKELKLFWFSQTIGKNRGLENAIEAIGKLKKTHITLTLLGSVNEAIRADFLNLANQFGLEQNQLNFIPPIVPDKISELANKFDIGLALEPGFCLNNHLALSNKIFTYFTSGLAIIMTETSAQKQFLLTYPNIGQSYPIGNVDKLASIIDYYDKNRESLWDAKISAFSLAKNEMNWETESVKFLEIINNVIKDA